MAGLYDIKKKLYLILKLVSTGRNGFHAHIQRAAVTNLDLLDNDQLC